MRYLLFFAILLLGACGKQQVQLIVHHATIYTVDSGFSIVEAMAIANGKIVAIGTNQEILSAYKADSTLDAGGKAVYPGFNDAHAHFYGYATTLQSVDLRGTHSWEEVLERVADFAAIHPDGWLSGRGWDQNDWKDKSFPDNRGLDSLFPDRPVVLNRIDGHAAIANTAALQAAGVSAGQQIRGGVIAMHQGRLIGLLVDNAVALVVRQLPETDSTTLAGLLLAAQDTCFAYGLTSLSDCGLSVAQINSLRALQASGDLRLRINAMIQDEDADVDHFLKAGPIHTDYLRVASVKCYGDGALGSRGACLLEPYSDHPETRGTLLSDPAHFEKRARQLYENGFQLCTHAIGDSANRVLLQVYARVLTPGNDLRWRIEHAQVIDSADFALFGKYNIIPSVQPTHATSDMYWAADRLGTHRLKHAYAYQHLLQQNGWMPLGTDFPVEQVNPFHTFYAAVVRKDAHGWPAGGFQAGDAISRSDALKGMTLWAAKGSFEEKVKGSLEPGKWADFVIVDRDIMNVAETELLHAHVLYTYTTGNCVYRAKNQTNP